MTRIDFEALKQRIGISDIVNRFQLDFREVKPNQLRGNCPFPNHGGDRNSRSFAIDLQTDRYICSTHCGGDKGSLNFYCDLMGYDKKRDVYKAASELADLFCHDTEFQVRKVIETKPVKEKKKNTIFEHRLKLLPAPELQKAKKLAPETLRYFGAGKANVGLLNGHYAVPMHDKQGYPIGYAGQHPETGKWKFFFNKSLELFNYHRLRRMPDVKQIIIVESFWSVMFLHQSGIPNVLAIMGIHASSEQVRLLKELSASFVLLLDNDDAGRKGTALLAEKLKDTNLRIFNYPAGIRKPREIGKGQMRKLV